MEVLGVKHPISDLRRWVLWMIWLHFDLTSGFKYVYRSFGKGSALLF